MSQPAVIAPVRASLLRRAFGWWLMQVKHALPPTIFFFVGFNLILWTKRLALEEHGIEFSGFFTATVAALLLVGKAVLVTDKLPFMRRFDPAPMIQPILFKSAIYWLCVMIVRLVEALFYFLAAGGVFADFPIYLVERFSWSRFWSIQLWLMVLFLVYVTIHELNLLFGDGELYRLFFRWRSSEAKLTRRRRIRLLIRLSRLTETNSIAAISEQGSRPYTELVGILRELASPAPPATTREPSPTGVISRGSCRELLIIAHIFNIGVTDPTPATPRRRLDGGVIRTARIYESESLHGLFTPHLIVIIFTLRSLMTASE
jgi:hypothetical protein